MTVKAKFGKSMDIFSHAPAAKDKNTPIEKITKFYTRLLV